MANASPQFSPAQLLDSGRRAETEGKLDLAAQFYRHLTDHHAYTAEAAEARNGLGRVGAAQSQVWQPIGNGGYANGNGHANGHLNGGAHAAIGSPVNGGAYVNGDVHFNGGSGYANGTAHLNGGAPPIAEPGYRAPRSQRAPRRRPVAPRDHYRAGRFMARAFSGLGWLFVAAGPLSAGLYFLPGSPLLHFEMLPVLGSSMAAVVTGFAIVFSGQIARAVFDQANATRDLVALERAKYGD
jgi:hypothetical protein